VAACVASAGRGGKSDAGAVVPDKGVWGQLARLGKDGSEKGRTWRLVPMVDPVGVRWTMDSCMGSPRGSASATIDKKIEWNESGKLG
jgi:hypothetical protein